MDEQALGVALKNPGWSIVVLALYWILRHEFGNGKTKALVDYAVNAMNEAIKKHDEAVRTILEISEEQSEIARYTRETHEVVVTGDRVGAIPQKPRNTYGQ